MSQTSYNINQGVAYAGMKADSRIDTVESKSAEGAVPFGYGVLSGNESAVNNVRIPCKTKVVVTGDADLVGSNSSVATVNGTALAAVVYGTDHATTIAAIAAKIATHADVLSAVVSAARAITVLSKNNVALTVTIVTTGGVSQPTWTPVQSDPGVFRGVSVHRHVEKSSAGVARYENEDTVDVMRQGSIWMPVVSSATPDVDDALYINAAAAGEEGKATDVSTNNIATGGVIREYDSVNKLAKIDINLP